MYTITNYFLQISHILIRCLAVIVVFCGRNGKFAAAKFAIFRNFPQILLFFIKKSRFFTIFIIQVIYKSDKALKIRIVPFLHFLIIVKALCLLYIDYIMIEKRWSSSIQNVTTKRDADCNADHELLVATLKIRLKCKKKTDLPICYNVQDISQDFKVEIRNCFKVLLEHIAEKYLDEIANERRNIFMETAGKHLRKRTN